MLAQTAARPFDSDRHLFEIKWDGTRCLAFIERGRVRLQNRHFVEMRGRYPELAGLRRLPSGTVLDGEVVVLEDGKPSFRKLQQRDQLLGPIRIEMLSQRLPATLIVFDLVYFRGESLTQRPLIERRERLKEVIHRLTDPYVIPSDFILKHGKRYFEEVERQGLEGMMAKRLDSPYLPGKRSAHWLKIKVGRTASVSFKSQSFVSS